MEALTLPALYCPFPSAINLHAAAVQAHTRAWVVRFALVTHEAALRRFDAAQFGRLAARAYPTADLAELEIVSDWNVWLFMLDDQCDEGGIGRDPDRLRLVFDLLLDLLCDTPAQPPATPLAASLHDLWQRMTARSTPEWRARFIADAADYFDACLWEAANRAAQRVPGMAEYIAYRPLTGGLITDVDLIDLTEHIDLPLAVRQHPVVQRLTAMANNVVCWSNDIISLEKELRRDDVHNLVLALRQEQQCDLQTAVERVAALHDAEVRAFLALERQLPHWNDAVDAALRRYVAVLRSWMRGNLDWAHETGRYQRVEPSTAGDGVSYLEPIITPIGGDADEPLPSARVESCGAV